MCVFVSIDEPRQISLGMFKQTFTVCVVGMGVCLGGCMYFAYGPFIPFSMSKGTNSEKTEKNCQAAN